MGSEISKVGSDIKNFIPTIRDAFQASGGQCTEPQIKAFLSSHGLFSLGKASPGELCLHAYIHAALIFMASDLKGLGGWKNDQEGGRLVAFESGSWRWCWRWHVQDGDIGHMQTQLKKHLRGESGSSAVRLVYAHPAVCLS